jgi:hypothetical protein
LRKKKKRFVILPARRRREGRAVCALKDLSLTFEQDRNYSLHFSFFPFPDHPYATIFLVCPSSLAVAS